MCQEGYELNLFRFASLQLLELHVLSYNFVSSFIILDFRTIKRQKSIWELANLHEKSIFAFKLKQMLFYLEALQLVQRQAKFFEALGYFFHLLLQTLFHCELIQQKSMIYSMPSFKNYGQSQQYLLMNQAFLYSRKKYSSVTRTQPATGLQQISMMLKKKMSSPKQLIVIRQNSPLSSELAKSIPQNMIYDKQALYMEVQELKKTINKLTNENTKLKTRISIYQTGRSRNYGSRYNEEKQERQREYNRSALMANSSQLDSLKNEILKNQIKQLKNQLQIYKKDNQCIKHTLKYSKINELQLQIKVVIEENKSLYKLYQQAKYKLKGMQYTEYQVLEQKLKQLSKQNKLYSVQIQNLNSEIMNLQMELRRKMVIRGNKDESGQIDQEKRQAMKKLREKINVKKLQNSPPNVDIKLNSNKAKQKIMHSFKANHVHIQDFRKNNVFAPNFAPKFNERGGCKSLEQNQKPQLFDQDQKLKQKISLTARKASENEMSRVKCQTNTPQVQSKPQSKISDFLVVQQNLTKEQNVKRKQDQNFLITQKDNFMAHSQIFQQLSVSPNQNAQLPSQQILNPPQQAALSEKMKKNIKKSNSQRDANEQKSQSIQDQLQQSTKTQYLKEGHKSAFQTTKTFNFRLLKELRQILTYRFKCQRYRFADLKKDIQSSKTKKFSYGDVCHMLVNEPFFLSIDNCRILAIFIFDIFDKQQLKREQVIETPQLLIKLRKMIQDYQELNKEQEILLIQRCVGLIRKNGKSLNEEFQSNKKQQNTIQIAMLRKILTKYGFARQEIEYMLTEISINVNDLQSIPYDLLFERFLIVSSARSSHLSKRQVIFQKEDENSELKNSRKSCMAKSKPISRKSGRNSQRGERNQVQSHTEPAQMVEMNPAPINNQIVPQN